MCSHNFVRVNDVIACTRCGLTRTNDGRVIFDRKLVNYKPKKRKVRKREKA